MTWSIYLSGHETSAEEDPGTWPLGSGNVVFSQDGISHSETVSGTDFDTAYEKALKLIEQWHAEAKQAGGVNTDS